jgi:hypothetical protein
MRKQMKEILSRYIITNIVNIILLYVGKFKLQHIKSIQLYHPVRSFYVHGENIYFDRADTILYEITDNEIKSYRCPLTPYDIFNKDIVLTKRHTDEYKVYNFRTLQVLQSIQNLPIYPANQCH